MNKLLFVISLFIYIGAAAQKKMEFYNWQWQPCEIGQARFMAELEKTDSGWKRLDYFTATNKLQMAGLFADSACKIENGQFYYFYANDNLSSMGKYINGKKQGLWLSYNYDGSLEDSTSYDAGMPTGTSMSWHSNGYMSDSIVYDNEGNGVQVRWFDNGNLSAAGRISNQKKTGRWKYFHKNGNPSAVEDYLKGKLTARTYYDENGSALSDTANQDRDADFTGGTTKWRKFLENNIQFPANYNLVNTDLITVVIVALIDEEGKLTEINIKTPFNPVFDNEALRVMKKSPKWTPAIRQNRKVKMLINQPVTFEQY